MLMGYVFFHMLGNLKVYLGAEDINHYGEWLRDLLVPFFPRTVTLWLLRIGLIAAFVFHIHAAYGADPHRTARRAPPVATSPSATTRPPTPPAGRCATRAWSSCCS